jgi:ribosome biogenesis protein ENP2
MYSFSVDIRKRIELIQDFEMPGLSTTVRVSADGNFILATGIYKPRVRCYDVNNLCMKFERCFDSEVVTFEILSEDYSKVSIIISSHFRVCIDDCNICSCMNVASCTGC